MKFSAPLFLLALGALAQAAPTETNEDLALGNATIEIAQQHCAPGKYFCGNLYVNGHEKCTSCGIATGNAEGKCVINNLCSRKNHSCKVKHGNPYCV